MVAVKRHRLHLIVPNLITLFRLLLIPVFVVLLINPTDQGLFIATIVFIVAAFTDYLDGVLARRWGAISNFGKLLDPLADKILVMAALVMLVGLRSDVTGAPWIPAWMVVLILSREIWVTGLRGVAASAGLVIAAGQSGKVKSLLQMVSIAMILIHDRYVFQVGDYPVTLGHVGLNLLLISIFFSYWGALHYSHQVFREVGLGTGDKES